MTPPRPKRKRAPRLTPNRSPWYLARIEAGLTQEEASQRSAVSEHHISRIERGEVRNPHQLTVRALAGVYGCTEEQLTGTVAGTAARRDVPHGTRQMLS